MNRCLPFLEELGLFDTISSDDCAVSEFAESANAGLERAKLATESLQEGLDLTSDHMTWDFSDIVEADFNNGFGFAEAIDNWIVQNVLEPLVRD